MYTAVTATEVSLLSGRRAVGPRLWNVLPSFDFFGQKFKTHYFYP